MKYLSHVLAIFLCVLLLPISYVASAAEFDGFYEGFDTFATNDIPSEIDVNADTYYIKEYAEGKKGLCLALGKQQTTVQFPVGVQGSFCLQFDMACTTEAVDGTLTIQDTKNKVDILKFYKDKSITAANGKPVFGYGKTMARFAIVYDTQKGTCDMYRNGRLFEKGYRFKTGSTLASAENIIFTFLSETPGREIIIDNLCVTSGATLSKYMPKSEYNDEVLEEPNFTHEIRIGNRAVLNCDFETALPLTFWKNGSIIEQYKEEDGNTAVLFERKDVGDFHLNASGFNHQSDTMVIEYDLKILEPLTAVNFMLQDQKGNTSLYGQVVSGGMLKFGNESVKLEMNKWYTFSVIINLYDRTITTFVDGEEKSTRNLGGGFAVGSGVNHLRYHVPPTTSLASSPVKFLTDNLKIYEGIELVEELGDIKNEITLTGKTVFPSESSLRKSMKDFFSVHARSGVVFANNTKTMLANKPYEKDGTVYVNADELSSVLGIETKLNGDVPIGEFASASGLVHTKVTNPLNDGLYILGKSSFQIPKDAKDVDVLNDFLFYFRPSSEQILEMYEKSPTKNQHPRIQATAQDFARIREQIKTNTYMKLWSDRLFREANALFDKKPVIYEFKDGVRLLMVSREVMNNMYTLGMAYQLTGDKKYVDRAWLDLKAVCVDFFDWHPGHDIDCAEMAAAVAIGYDWMYDAFTEEQRLAIEDGIYQKGLYQAALGFQSTNAPMGSIAIWGQNRTIVCCSGVSMAALAVLDVYPEEAAFIISSGARAVESVIDKFGPDGAYFEGPSYWEYTMQYVAKHLTSLESALGSNLRLDCVEGLSITTDYELHMQTSNGTYIFGDGSSVKTYVPEMLWLADLYDNKGNAEVVMKLTNGNFSGGEDLVLALLWYDVNTNTNLEKINMPLQGIFPSDDTISLRESWQYEGSATAWHAGTSHSHLDGASFIYENAGIRWAIDPGSGNYNQTGYFDSAVDGRKWRIYYCRAESHNTLVVNPSELPDHIPYSYAPLVVKEVKDRGAIAVAETTELHRDVSYSRRGFMFTDNRQSLVVRDEVNVTKESDVYWFMQTKADVSVDKTGATLVSKGKTLRLDFVANNDSTIEVGQSTPLPTSPVEPDDRYGNFNRIVIKMHGNGAMNLTVKLTPGNIDATPISDYDKSVDLWTVPDGPIPAAPKLDTVKVGGVDMSVDNRDIVYNYVEGSLSTVPDIEAYSSKHKVEITKSDSISEASLIKVIDANDSTNVYTYRVIFNELKKPVEFDGLTSIPIVAVEASAEPQEENRAINVIDGNLSTRWSAEGPGQTITVDIGKITTMDKLAVAFYDGHLRTTNITILVSKDNMEYEEVFRGASKGGTKEHEFFELSGKEARYVKLICDGASNSTWNSINEIVVTQIKK